VQKKGLVRGTHRKYAYGYAGTQVCRRVTGFAVVLRPAARLPRNENRLVPSLSAAAARCLMMMLQRSEAFVDEHACRSAFERLFSVRATRRYRQSRELCGVRDRRRRAPVRHVIAFVFRVFSRCQVCAQRPGRVVGCASGAVVARVTTCAST